MRGRLHMAAAVVARALDQAHEGEETEEVLFSLAALPTLYPSYTLANARQAPPEPSSHGIRPTTIVAPRGGSCFRLRRFSTP
jgi:hypothetical protein